MSELNPLNNDAILGGQNPPPVNAAVLGGLAGIKQRLESESIAERLQALNNAIAYGNDGIDLAIRSLTDENIEVQKLAEKLLQYHFGRSGEEALLDRVSQNKLHLIYNPFIEWKKEKYNHQVGITDPESTAYIVRVSASQKV